MRLTPRLSIKEECKYCKNGNSFSCNSAICSLNKKKLTPLKRIKSHCINCVGTRQEVIKCRGKVLYSNNKYKKCSLWKYRLGLNPYLKGIGNRNINKLGHKTRFCSKKR